MRTLDVIVPGLLGPFPAEVPAYISEQLKTPAFKALNTCLSRAELSAGQASNFYTTLYRLICPQCTLSACELMAHFDSVDTTQGFVYRADPVHFKAESDHAILLGSQLLAPELHEAEQLVDAFNQHFAEDKISLSLGGADRWYIQCEKPLALQFHALDYALGRDIKHFMPLGDDSLWWRRIVNEAQMLFFQHAVNEQRESAGKLTINGLWLWDMAIEPAATAIDGKVEEIFADDVMASALAAQAGVAIQPLSHFAQTTEFSAHSVLLQDQLYEAVCYGDISAWVKELEIFASETFVQILDRLKSKQLDVVNIYPCDGRVFTLTRGQLLKFWKTSQRIDQLFAEPN